MSELPKEVRKRTDKLDAVGNTTAAIGKGFAIASAALTALALFGAYMTAANIRSIDISKSEVMAGLLIGAMLPFVFSALSMNAVGRAAMSMINEVRRQFKDIPALKAALEVMRKNDGKDMEHWSAEDQKTFQEADGKAEYGKCVEISTKAAIREMVFPGLLAVLVPVAVGFTPLFGAEGLGGLLAGVTVAGVLMAIFQSNAGGAWDNAKKSFEEGVEINGQKYYKGSDPHKAAVVGDTVGDPFKDTSGPSLNILLKLMSVVALVIAPLIALEKMATPVAPESASMISTEAAAGPDLTEAAGSWVIDGAHTFVDFRIRHIMTDAKGSFENVSGEVNLTPTLEGSSIMITMDPASINTKNEKRDTHLRSADFFDVANHPEMFFKSTEVSKTNDGYVAKGILKIHGIEKEILLPFKYAGKSKTPFDVEVIAFHAEYKINRNDFGISYMPGVLGDEVFIEISVEANPAPAPAQ